MVRRCLPVLVLVAVAAADDVTADLAWRSTERRQYKPGKIKLAPEPPEKVRALEKVEAPLYGRRPLGDRHLLVAADLTAGAWRLWIDRDFDGDLNDETPVPFGPRGTYGAQTVPVKVGDEDIDLYFYKYTGDTRLRVHVMALAHREGTVVLEGRVRKLALYDGDSDLRFDGVEDLFFLDVNGDGRLDRGEASFERIFVGQPFRLRDRGYFASFVDPTAGRIVFRRVDPAPPPARRVWRSQPVPLAGVAARPGGQPLKVLKSQYRSARGVEKTTKWVAIRRQTTALGQIGNLGTREAFQFLHSTYRVARNPVIQAAAVRAMGYRDYVEYAGKLVRIARKDEDLGLRAAAMESLHRMDAPERAAVYAEILKRATEESEATAAARHLAWTGDGAGQDMLREAVTQLPKLAHRYGVYMAATRYRKQAPSKELIVAAARGVDPRLRNQGLRDAFYLGLPETRLLALECARAAKSDVALQMAVTEILAGSYADPEAIGALLPLAEGASPTLRGRLIDLLRPVRADTSVAALLAGLEWQSPDVRALVAEILTAIPTRRVKEALATRLVAERAEPALTALIRAAGRLRLVAAAPAIVAAAQRQRDNQALQQTALRALGLIGLADSVVLEFFLERAASPRWEERLIVLDAAAESGDPRAAGLLLKSLADDIWQVRLTVVQGLARVRVRQAVPVLIAQLEREQMKRIRRAIGETLFKLTGQSFFDLSDLWERWWQEYGEGFVVPADVPERKVRKDGRRTVATFYGVPVESDRVVFVIDHSGSMGSRRTEGGTEFDKAVTETLDVAAKLESGARLNVILFESAVTRWKKGLVPVNRKNRSALRGYLRNKNERGGTNLFDALEMALLTKDVDSIYLLSDGHPNEGKFVRHDDILRAVRDLNQVRRIAIHGIALGYESDLLRDLAAQSGGTYARR